MSPRLRDLPQSSAHPRPALSLPHEAVHAQPPAQCTETATQSSKEVPASSPSTSIHRILILLASEEYLPGKLNFTRIIRRRSALAKRSWRRCARRGVGE